MKGSAIIGFFLILAKKASIYQQTTLFSKVDLESILFPNSPPMEEKSLSTTQEFQITPIGKGIDLPSFNIEYKALTDVVPLFDSIQITLSSPSLFTILPCSLEKKTLYIVQLSTIQILRETKILVSPFP